MNLKAQIIGAILLVLLKKRFYRVNKYLKVHEKLLQKENRTIVSILSYDVTRWSVKGEIWILIVSTQLS